MSEIKLNEQLFHAIKTRNSNLASRLIRAGADPNAAIEPELYKDIGIFSNFHGVVPLHVAAVKGDIKTAQVLIENGADVDAAMLFTSGGKRTALYLAVEAQDLKMVRLLLRYKAKVNVQVMDSCNGNRIAGNYGCTPLHCAIALENLVIAALLIEYGADINAQVKGNILGRKGTNGASGYTPLHIAVKKGNLDAVKLFLDYGVNTDIKDDFGNTPLKLAHQKGKLEIAELIKKFTSSEQPKMVDKKPIIPAVEDDKNTGGMDVVREMDINKENEQPKIVCEKPIIPAVKDDKNTGGMYVARKIDKEVEGKKPAKLAKEHNLFTNDKNPEIFASKIQLTKFVNKASLPIAGIASIILVYCIVAELSLALIISAAVVAFVALIAKPIASYIEKDLVENSAVSRTLDTPNIKQPQAAAQTL